MKISSDTRAWPAALAVAAVLAVAVLSPGTASAQKTRADQCSEMLQKNYGVASLAGVDQHNASNRRSVYASGTLDNGQTVRFRCLIGERNAPEVQVYAPPPLGSPTSGSKWGAADDYRVPARAEATPREAKPAEPAEPEQAPPEPQGPKRVKPNPGS